MDYVFTTASRQNVLLRILLCGASGHGKTFTALALMHHFGVDPSKIAVIDTETQERRDGTIVGSVEKYVGAECECHHCQGHGVVFGQFAQLKLPPGHREPEDYQRAIRAAEAAGFEGLIVDSFSHEWEACKRRVDRIKPKFRGNKWAAWSAVTPLHDECLQALLDFPGHVIACVRGKEKTEQQGKDIVSRGLLPIQREQIEFEFDVWLNLYHQVADVAKTRAKRLRGRDFQRPGKELAEELLGWANGGTAGADRSADRLELERRRVAERAEALLPELSQKVAEKLAAARNMETVAAIGARVDAKLAESSSLRSSEPQAPPPEPPPADVEANALEVARRDVLELAQRLPEGVYRDKVIEAALDAPSMDVLVDVGGRAERKLRELQGASA